MKSKTALRKTLVFWKYLYDNEQVFNRSILRLLQDIVLSLDLTHIGKNSKGIIKLQPAFWP